MLLDKEAKAALGEYLADKRLKVNYSQGDIAKKLGLSSPQYISNMERGLAEPSPGMIRVMLKLYEIPYNEFERVIVKIVKCNLKRGYDNDR